MHWSGISRGNGLIAINIYSEMQFLPDCVRSCVQKYSNKREFVTQSFFQRMYEKSIYSPRQRSTAEVHGSVSLWSQFTTAASRRTVPSLMISVSQSAFAYLSHLNVSDQTNFNIRQKYPEFSFICHTQA